MKPFDENSQLSQLGRKAQDSDRRRERRAPCHAEIRLGWLAGFDLEEEGEKTVLIELPCLGEPSKYELSEPELESLQRDYPSVNVAVELAAFSAYLREDRTRLSEYRRMAKRVNGWMARARPKEETRGKQTRMAISETVQQAIDRYRAEGLIIGDFVPTGDNDRDKLRSVEARAYTTWIRQHPHLDLSVEQLRTTFLNRYRDAGIDQAAGVQAVAAVTIFIALSLFS